MRKLLAIILTLVLVLSLSACGKKNTNVDTNKEKVNSNLHLVSTDDANSYTFDATPSETNEFFPIGKSFLLNDKKYTLSFFDDFNGTELDSTKWARSSEIEHQDYGAKWDDDMVWLDGKGFLNVGVAYRDGKLIAGRIRTRTIDTQNLFAQKRGYFEISCKLPKATGCWSAFWLMSSLSEVKKVGNGALDGAEIDVFESFDVKNNVVNHAVHCDGYEKDHKAMGVTTQNFSLYDGNFHTFAVLWNENGYYFYVDGVMTKKFDNTQENFLGSCETEMFMLISTEFGSWGGLINLSLLPDALVVDYVRAYKEN